MKKKHIHLIDEAINKLETIINEYLYEYENNSSYKEETKLAKRLLNFINSENEDYYDA